MLRVLRVLRVLRLLSTVRSMRRVVAAMVATVPGMVSIAALLGMLIYIGAVVATQLFGDTDGDHFGSLSASLRSMFQITTGDDWAAVIAPTADVHPWSYVFFVVYIVLSTYIVLNLFIAVAVEALDKQEDEARDELRHEVDEVEQAVDESSTAILAATRGPQEPGGGPRATAPRAVSLDLAALFLTFGAIFLVELPDKTFLATLVLADPYRPILVWIGVGAAFAVQTTVAVLLGHAVSFLPTSWSRSSPPALFLIGAVLLFREGRATSCAPAGEEDDAARSTPPRQRPTGFRAVVASFLVLFAAEWGDLSQLLTISLVARYEAPLEVFIGALAALLAVSGLAVLAGRTLLRFVPLHVLLYLGGSVCLVLEALTLCGDRALTRAPPSVSSSGTRCTASWSWSLSHIQPAAAATLPLPGATAIRSLSTSVAHASTR